MGTGEGERCPFPSLCGLPLGGSLPLCLFQGQGMRERLAYTPKETQRNCVSPTYLCSCELRQFFQAPGVQRVSQVPNPALNWI